MSTLLNIVILAGCAFSSAHTVIEDKCIAVRVAANRCAAASAAKPTVAISKLGTGAWLIAAGNRPTACD
jgi:hypothetical protein